MVISSVYCYLYTVFYSYSSHCINQHVNGSFLTLTSWQIQVKEKDTQQSKTLNQEFGQKIQGIANELNLILMKLKEKTNNIKQAKMEQKVNNAFVKIEPLRA